MIIRCATWAIWGATGILQTPLPVLPPPPGLVSVRSCGGDQGVYSEPSLKDPPLKPHDLAFAHKNERVWHRVTALRAPKRDLPAFYITLISKML